MAKCFKAVRGGIRTYERTSARSHVHHLIHYATTSEPLAWSSWWCFIVSQATLLSFLKGELQIAADEAFINAVQSYYEIFLKNERLASMVTSGACSQHDLREVFKHNVEKRVSSVVPYNVLDTNYTRRMLPLKS
ncbi:Calcium-dependent secretion activator [Portunus trituberculatus]|uniref:Calcium-dependent secretion activator n=1 Tax=Portunus trituberculatus TaxID=210409 RepID=A0A5B7JHZ1_PORTR|nr:Calcium-dependent secretion activator [Portunus trituberculatus]